MNNNLNRKNKIRNEDDIQLDGINKNKIYVPISNFLEKSKNMISQYMNAESQRSKEIMLKEEVLKIKREREDIQRKIERIEEDTQRKIDRISEDGQRARERLGEDFQLKKEKEIMEFEGEIKLIYLKKNLRDDFEGFPKEEKIIPLNEESGKQNQDNMDIKPKKKSKKAKGKKMGVNEN